MAKIIRWNKKAIKQMDDLVDYSDQQRSFQATQKFIRVVDSKIERLKSQPLIGRRVLTMKTVRFVLIDDKLRMYYRVYGTTVFITAFFDTRQDPSKRPYQ